jgi:hypothetical protein
LIVEEYDSEDPQNSAFVILALPQIAAHIFGINEVYLGLWTFSSFKGNDKVQHSA